MPHVVKTEPIRCSDCVAQGERARRVGAIDLLDDRSFVAWVQTRDRNRSREPELRAAQDAGLRLVRRRVLDPGERVEVRCGRRHDGRPGIVVLDDAAIAVALRRAGAPADLRRLSGDDVARVFGPVYR